MYDLVPADDKGRRGFGDIRRRPERFVTSIGFPRRAGIERSGTRANQQTDSIPQHVRSATRTYRDSWFAQQSGARDSRGFGTRARTPKEQAQDGRGGRSRTDSLPQDVHPAISATAKALRKAKPNPDEVIAASGHGYCGIEVGVASLERTIAVLDSIARALDARGLKVEPIGNCMRLALPPDSERIEKRNHVQPAQPGAGDCHRRGNIRDGLDRIGAFGQRIAARAARPQAGPAADAVHWPLI